MILWIKEEDGGFSDLKILCISILCTGKKSDLFDLFHSLQRGGGQQGTVDQKEGILEW